jgi:hypothetical protein
VADGISLIANAYRHPSLWWLASAHRLCQRPQAKHQSLRQKQPGISPGCRFRPPKISPLFQPYSLLRFSLAPILLPFYLANNSIHQKWDLVKCLPLKFLMEMRGLEPLTSSVQGRRSPSELHPPTNDQLPKSQWSKIWDLVIGSLVIVLVGLSGLEPETFPLSEECSSRLS